MGQPNRSSARVNYRRSALVRFIGRRRRLLTPAQGSIDLHGPASDRRLLLDESVPRAHVRRGAPYFVRGWAIDLVRRQIPWDVLVEVDGRVIPAQTHVGLTRADVARDLGEDLTACGFTASFDTRSLAVGPHDLSVRAVVGRRGAAFAAIPETVRFFVFDMHPPALPRRAELVTTFSAYGLHTGFVVPAGGIFELLGWALDERKRPVTGVAAQIDDDPWIEGWTGTGRPGAFVVRIAFDTIKAGVHTLRVAGKTRDGRWGSLGEPSELLVTTSSAGDDRWVRALTDGGVSSITSADGGPLTTIVLYRRTMAITIRGTLRWNTPLGPFVKLAAGADDGTEIILPAWSAPSADPLELTFGAKLSPNDLAPNVYHLFVYALDVSQRFIGRSDPGCVLVVRPNAGQVLV